MLLLYDANPIFSAPAVTHIREAIAKIPYIVSFGSFIDETSAQADLILPDHAPLESWLDSVPESGSFQSVVSVAPPAVAPLHDTRSMPDVLLGLTQKIGGDVAKALPWTSYDAMLKAALVPLRAKSGSINAKTDDEFWSAAQTQGGWWSTAGAKNSASVAAAKQAFGATTAPEFAGGAAEFPFYFQPYVTPSFGDGSMANLPWMQELPDVLTTAMWSSWVEINPKTGERLGIGRATWWRSRRRLGACACPRFFLRELLPIYWRCQLDRGMKILEGLQAGAGRIRCTILAPVAEHKTGALAWAATRVKITRVGGPEQAKLVLFAGGMSGFPHEEEPR